MEKMSNLLRVHLQEGFKEVCKLALCMCGGGRGRLCMWGGLCGCVCAFISVPSFNCSGCSKVWWHLKVISTLRVMCYT